MKWFVALGGAFPKGNAKRKLQILETQTITQTNLQVETWCGHNPVQCSSWVLSQIQCASELVPSRTVHPQNRI